MAAKDNGVPDWLELLINRGTKWLGEMLDQVPDAPLQAQTKTDVPSPVPPLLRSPRGPTNTRDVWVLTNCARIVHSYGPDGKRLFEQLLAQVHAETTNK